MAGAEPTVVGGRRAPSWRALVDGAAGTGLAALDARRIGEQASGWAGADWLSHQHELATTVSQEAFDSMVARRRTGEPLQYVLGGWGFRTLDLFVDRRVLIPRPETEQLVEAALGELDALEGRLAADLGTGSGAIALALVVERPRVEVWATDASADALHVAGANLAGAGRPGARVHLAQGSWFTALPDVLLGRLDLVVVNPPYVGADEVLPGEVADWEPRAALVAGPSGLEAIEQIARESPAWLRRPGALVMEIGETQGDAVLGLAEAAGFAHAEIRPDLAGRPRTLVARAARAARPARPARPNPLRSGGS